MTPNLIIHETVALTSNVFPLCLFSHKRLNQQLEQLSSFEYLDVIASIKQ